MAPRSDPFKPLHTFYTEHERTERRRRQLRAAAKRHAERKKRQDPGWRQRLAAERRARVEEARLQAPGAIARGETPPGMVLWSGADLTTEQLEMIWDYYIGRGGRYPTNGGKGRAYRLAAAGIVETLEDRIAYENGELDALRLLTRDLGKNL
jgi:hypothetical protein